MTPARRSDQRGRTPHWTALGAYLCAALAYSLPIESLAEIPLVRAQQRITEGDGGFSDILGEWAHFAYLAPLGDLDGDGVLDAAVGAPNQDGGGRETGAVWVLFLNRDGTLQSERKICGNTGSGE